MFRGRPLSGVVLRRVAGKRVNLTSADLVLARIWWDRRPRSVSPADGAWAYADLEGAHDSPDTADWRYVEKTINLVTREAPSIAAMTHHHERQDARRL